MRIEHMLWPGVLVALLTALPASAYQSADAQRDAKPVAQSAPLNQSSPNLIYGSQLMTPAERRSYRDQMRSMKTVEEREALRKQHHDQMQKRAAERGMTLPEMPPRQGAGMGPGMPMGQGRGMGQGMPMGQGRGMGQGAGQGMHRGLGMGQGTGMSSGSGTQQSVPQAVQPQQESQSQNQKTQQKPPAEHGTSSSNDDGNLPR